MAASVRTLVVSWKEAAERKESVAREALVMPMQEAWWQVGSSSSLAVLAGLAGVDAGLDGGLGVLEGDSVSSMVAPVSRWESPASSTRTLRII